MARALQRASAWSTSTINSSCSTADGQKGIFDREAELDQLRSLQRQRPASVTVVLGPRSCGKTAVLQELFAKQADAVYIDCRGLSRGSPASLIKALLKELAAKAPVNATERAIAAFGQVAATVISNMKIDQKADGMSFTISEIAKRVLTSEPQQQDLDAVFQALGWVGDWVLPVLLYCLYQTSLVTSKWSQCFP